MNPRRNRFSLLISRGRLAWSWCVWILLAASALGYTAQKPDKTVIGPGYDPHRIAVKFRDGLHVRLRNNVLVSTNAGLFVSAKALFDSLSAGQWQRADAISEEEIDQMRWRAEKRLGRALHDLNLQFYLTLPPRLEAGPVIDRLNQLDFVELAQPVPLPVRLPLPPNFEPEQTNCFPAPVGGGIFNVWSNYGIFGAGVWVADVEYSYNSNHLDLPAIVNLDNSAVDPFDDNNHGTATQGEIAALENGWGTTGIGYGASFYFAGASYASGYDVGRGITTAANQLRPGDVLLVEQQIYGPNTTADIESFGGEYSLVPVDWYGPYYDRVVTAVGNGIIVIETAGNGGQNLDDPVYQTGNGGLWPFQAQNRSGAILVGAGASYHGSSTENSRLDYSNYGSCIDLQGWGENIITTGYGDLYDSEGANLYYTATFGGTSGATPIAVGEAVLLQSIYENATGEKLTSEQIRILLRDAGEPQTGGAYTAFENIGPMPNFPRAVSVALSNTGPPVIVACSTNVVALLGGTATLSVAASGAPANYQWSFQGANLTDQANVFGSSNADLVLTSLSAADAGAYTVTVSNASGETNASAVLSVISDPALTPGVFLTNVYTFTDSSDGSGPVGLTPDGQGNFFGMQEYGGTNGYGGIFEFVPEFGSLTELYSFTNGTDGAYPFAPLVLGSDGNYYGTTSAGGADDAGTIFNFSPAGSLTVLYTFTGGSDGGTPNASLMEASNGLFYGTTYYGGQNYGVVFTIDSSGDYQVVHAFDYNDGSGPYGGLVQTEDGSLYGTTDYGGANNLGTIYSITPSGEFQSRFSFNGTDGSSPSDKLVQGLDGKLYGRTYYGGAHKDGTVYSFTTNGVFQSLFSFSGTNGAYPYPALICGRDGNLYGLTQYGGTNGGDGVIYEVTPSGFFAVIARFSGINGVSPFAPMTRGIDGNFYGTTYSGAYGDGNVFLLKFAATPPAFQAAFQNGSQIQLAWNVIPGRTYQVQYTTNLATLHWSPLGGPAPATNGILSVTDSVTGSQRFYRALLEMP